MINNVNETFDRSLSEVLRRYYRNGGNHTLGLTVVEFAPCDIHFDITRLDTPAAKPVIVFAGSRVTGQEEMTANDPNNILSNGYEVRAKIERTVFVKSRMKEGDPTGTIAYAKKIYDSLFALFTIQHIEFASVGIFQPQLQIYAEEAEATDFFLLVGTFKCNVSCAFARQAT